MWCEHGPRHKRPGSRSDQPEPTIMADEPRKPLSEAAARALAEAEARRAEYERAETELARRREIDGRKGPEPVRYGDWERNGIASDF
jgi:hypothetical protein